MPKPQKRAVKLLADNFWKLSHPDRGQVVHLTGFGSDSMAPTREHCAIAILHLLKSNGFDLIDLQEQQKKSSPTPKDYEPHPFIQKVLDEAAAKTVAKKQAT